MSTITVTDQFCGAGGSSQGVRNVANRLGPGLEVKLAMNHWNLAIETHNTNFPEAIHDCTDISAADPRRYPKTTILITSPECTNHSLAKGKKIAKAQIDLFNSGKLDPAAERSRATMWDVPRFAEYHKYEIIIVENVVDARKWIMFDSWLMAMHSLGYLHECVYLNSMHCHPTPQSRDRMYVVFWKKGNRKPNLDFTPEAHCPTCHKTVKAIQSWKNPLKKFGKFRQQYVYRCPTHGSIVEPFYYSSFNCIDWSDLGTRISDRSKPLSDKTIQRIQYGIDKFCGEPVIVTTRYSSGVDCRVKSILDVVPTQPGDASHSIAIPTPFIIKAEHSPIKNARSANQPLTTQTTRQSMSLITPPLITELRGTSKARSSLRELNAVTAGGIHSGIVTTDNFKAFTASYYGTGHSIKSIKAELGTVTTKDRSALVSYNKPNIEDCFYRMLKSPEIGRAMAFSDDYIVLGTEKDKVKQYGNAVTPPAMEWLVERSVQSLEGKL